MSAHADNVISSRIPTPEEQYYLEHAYKDPVKSLERIEETAKFLIGATATTSGLFVAAFKLALGKTGASGLLWFAPFVLWATAMLALLLVLLPQRYSVGRDEPALGAESLGDGRRLAAGRSAEVQDPLAADRAQEPGRQRRGRARAPVPGCPADRGRAPAPTGRRAPIRHGGRARG